MLLGARSEHLWANLHKTNMAADKTCVTYSVRFRFGVIQFSVVLCYSANFRPNVIKFKFWLNVTELTCIRRNTILWN